MAHFCHPQTRNPLGKVTVAKGGKFKIVLWGGGPGGAILRVTTDPNSTDPDPAVTGGETGADWFRELMVDTNRIKSNKLYGMHGTSPWTEPLLIEFGTGPAPTAFGKADIRKSIVDLARTFVADSHYLWGTAGNTPGSSDGNPGGGKTSICTLREPVLDATATLPKEKVLGVRMAVQSIADGYNTCAGRSVGRTGVLKDYLEAAEKAKKQSKDQTTWPGSGALGLHPRRYHHRGNLQAGGGVVWGEACDGHRHFDCIGLVNYCYAFHFHTLGFGVDIAVWKANTAGTVTITDPKDIMDADVIAKPDNGHIAMIYLAQDGKPMLVQAEDTTIGLTDNKAYDATAYKDWTRVRMLDVYLVPKRSSLK